MQTLFTMLVKHKILFRGNDSVMVGQAVRHYNQFVEDTNHSCVFLALKGEHKSGQQEAVFCWGEE